MGQFKRYRASLYVEHEYDYVVVTVSIECETFTLQIAESIILFYYSDLDNKYAKLRTERFAPAQT